MEKEVFDYDKTLCAMLIKMVDGFSFLNNEEKGTLFEMIYACKDDMKKLYKIYYEVINGKKDDKNENDLIQYSIDEDKHLLTYKGKKVKLKEVDILKVLSRSIDLLEEILPLGTVVELNKDFLNGIVTNIDTVNAVRMVITHRFLFKEGDMAYFTYAGVSYPVGGYDAKRMIHFTSAAIENVIYKGFSDEEEKAYICVMKNEMIVKKGMYSIGFAKKEEQDIFKKS